MKLNEIQDLIKFVSKSGVSEVELETKEIKIVIRTPKTAPQPQQVIMQPAQVMAAPAQSAPVSQMAPPAQAASDQRGAPPAASEDSKYVTIKSPMIGTFYRSAGPDKPPFVNIGDEVAIGKPV